MSHIFLSFIHRFVPESVRWLHANGKSEQLVEVVKKIQRINGKTPTDITVAPIHREKMSKPNPLDIFRPTKVAISTLIQSYGW